MPVGFLPVALPNQNRHRPLGLSLQHGRQTCRRKAFGLVQTVQSLFEMTHLPPDGGEQPNVVVKDTLFAQDFVDRQTPFTLNQPRLGLLKPLSSNSTPTDHSVTTATSLAGWLHIQWPTTTLVVTLQCLTGAWDRCSSSNLGTSGSSGDQGDGGYMRLVLMSISLDAQSLPPSRCLGICRDAFVWCAVKSPQPRYLFLRGSRFRTAPRLRLSSFTGA